MRVPAALLVQYWCVFCLCPKLQWFLWWFFPHLLTSFHCWHFEVVHSHLAPGILPQLREYKTTKKQVRKQQSNIQAGKKKCLKPMNQLSTWKPLIIFLSLCIHLESPREQSLSQAWRNFSQSHGCWQSSEDTFREYKIILSEFNFNFLQYEYPSRQHSNTEGKLKKFGRFGGCQKNPCHPLSSLNRIGKRKMQGLFM